MKHEREERFNALEAEFAARYSEEELVEKAPLIHKYFHDDVQKKAMRNMILDEGKRLDGRRTDEIRPIWCEVGYLPAAHGSAIDVYKRQASYSSEKRKSPPDASGTRCGPTFPADRIPGAHRAGTRSAAETERRAARPRRSARRARCV